MRVWVPNELVFTIFFEKEKASERMRDIFTDVYGEMDKAFTGTLPKEVYDSEKQDNYKNTITWDRES